MPTFAWRFNAFLIASAVLVYAHSGYAFAERNSKKWAQPFQTPHRFDDIPTGPLEDAKCNVENVESANSEQLNSLLMELTNTTYFRLFKVDLSANARFGKKRKRW